MCKIFTLSNASKLSVETDINIIAEELLLVERDGFGYAAQGVKGVFGEKSATNTFASQLFWPPNIGHRLPKIMKNSWQSVFGRVSKITGPAIFHGRTSTNKPGLINTHPMQKKSWHLVHNGVVDNIGLKYRKKTENDSEDVLHHLLSGGIDAVAKNLEGYYAFAAIDPTGQLHIARDDIAKLYLAWSASHDTFVFCTSESLLKKIAARIGMSVRMIGLVEQNYYFIMQKNDIISEQNFTPLGYTSVQSRFAKKSLGSSLSYANDRYSVDSWDSYASVECNDASYIDDLWDEFDSLDATYAIYDSSGHELSLTIWRSLTLSERLSCIIYREDGTELDMSALEDSYHACEAI